MGRKGLLALVLLGLVLSGSGAFADTLLVANKSDHTLSFVSTETGEIEGTVSTGQFPHEVSVSPDGRVAVVTNYGDQEKAGWTLTVVDVAARKVLNTIDLVGHYRPHGLAWLPDGNVVVTSEASAKVLVVNPSTGETLKEIPTGQRISHMVVATADGKRAFVANIRSGSVTVIDLEKGVKIKDIKTGAGAEGIALTPDGKELWVSNRSAGTLTVIDPSSLEILDEIECPGFPIRVAITPDGKTVLVSCAANGELAAFKRSKRKEIARNKYELEVVEGSQERLFGGRFGGSPVPVGLLVHPDGTRAYVAATQADVVLVVDPTTLELMETYKAGREPDGMAFSTVK